MTESPGLRNATIADLEAVGKALGMAAPALAPVLVDPDARVLVGADGQVVLLRRAWSSEGAAEAVVVRRAGVPLDHADVLAAAVGWGCDGIRHLATGRCLPVPAPSGGAPLPVRFVHLAARAATRIETAVAREGDAGGSAQAAAMSVLGALGLPVVTEETRDRPVPEDRPWIVLDPMDGPRGDGGGPAPWAFSAALVQEGRPVAGLVADLSSGHRWSAVEALGARRDGAPVRRSPESASGVGRRVRITGCAAVDLCLVADGAAAAWHDAGRSSTHVHDVAGGLAVLLAAGGTALAPDGRPLELRPDTEELLRFVAAADETTARELLDVVG